MKMDNNNGPNMTPMNPNKESPMTTPKMVMSGWVSAIFLFCRNKKRIRFVNVFVTINSTIKEVVRRHVSNLLKEQDRRLAGTIPMPFLQ